ncbi:DUF1816 domain-containing protein [Baaleninema sp.]|uniref:DUF1816 domain-containing protein n=1 Tax=Baaleninema sp. TaxID=3101197 RepID=UPI003CFDFFC0
MKEFFVNLLQTVGLAWWVKIVTETPQCTYYFGPFLSQREAEAAKAGYIEDLEAEGAQGIGIEVLRCKPTELTVFDEEAEMTSPLSAPILSGQT